MPLDDASKSSTSCNWARDFTSEGTHLFVTDLIDINFIEALELSNWETRSGAIEKSILKRSREKDGAQHILACCNVLASDDFERLGAIVHLENLLNFLLGFLNKRHQLIVVRIINLVADNNDGDIFLGVKVLFDEIEQGNLLVRVDALLGVLIE